MSRRNSWLFVPGDRPERFAKAEGSGAHAVVCDLEDAVLPRQKDEARSSVRRWMNAGGSAYVRINQEGSEWFGEDVETFAGLPNVRGILVPKCETPLVPAKIRERLDDDQELIILIESASGMARLAEVASVTGVTRLGFGSVDYAADLGIAHTPMTLLHARSALVMISRSTGLDAPLDGVTANFRDQTANVDDALLSRELGFGGKMCIHPNQIPVVNEAFRPTDGELMWARRVMQTASTAMSGAVTLDGQLIDAAVLRRAQAILTA